MAKIHIKSEKLTPFGGMFSDHGAIWLYIVMFSHEYLLLWWLMYPRMSLLI